ncbi:MAG: ABC transporter permease [Dehalococcoidales bacterium]|nr:ABC transporter permease [Dehalococcoidales bacterium]
MKENLGPLSAAWTSVATHKLRSFLTVLGIVIGVAAVIVLMSVGKGTQARILANLSSLGSNLIYVQPGSTTQGGVRSGVGTASTLTLEDAQTIASDVASVSSVAPYSTSSMQVIAPNQNMNVRITGVTPDYQPVFNVQIADGYFFNDFQYELGANVALLGPNISATLFGEDNPVDQTIRVGNNTFQVIGVLQSKGASMMGSTDDAILIPLSTFHGMMSRQLTSTGQHVVNTVALKISDKSEITSVKQDITSLLIARHNIAAGADNDFTISSLDELSATISESMQSMTLLLGAIAGISLLVGGIGVMNIMLVSVMERRREIGIRKALGAKEREIWGQFLVDSALLTFTGGVIGVAIGWGGSYLVNRFAATPTVVTPDIVILAVGVSVAIGLFFGFYPAWQGSKLNPIEALRAE